MTTTHNKTKIEPTEYKKFIMKISKAQRQFTDYFILIVIYGNLN